YMNSYKIIVTKSTVPVGTHRRLSDIIRAATDIPFDYVSNPEFLKEGAAVKDFLKPDRVILGLSETRPLRIMRHLYAPFMRRSERLLIMDPASAEITKYACNAMLATRISFVNELARLCHSYEADISLVRRGLGTDPRIGHDFLYPSIGYGGSCFPKDVAALIQMGRSVDQPMGVVEAVDRANEAQPEWMFQRIKAHFGDLSGKKLAVWGLAFKANTDDIRESQAIKLVRHFVDAGAQVAAHDPKAMGNTRQELGDKGITYCQQMYEPLEQADALVICTEWQQYRTPHFRKMAAAMKGNVIFDGRNLYELDWVTEKGFWYYSIGRPTQEPK
ncbi:MAG: UDP-glucose/GDP-mannose dehydrogenase family protein, partial [Proteobacteria bacterium]|nr:UDP-glucose/GDP-mannose dehydrogenase family protein [Pseudomonadota bacterium]